jgi:hypothetical protein
VSDARSENSAGEAASPASRLARTRMGQRLSGFIYGTIIALSVIVAGARAYPHSAGHIAALVAVTCTVFWIAHVYAHGLGHSAAQQEHMTLEELLEIARREGSIVEAALLPVAALLLGAAGIVSTHLAVWLAFALGLVFLGAQGIVFARVERLSPLATAFVIIANLSLGLILVALKLVLTH